MESMNHLYLLSSVVFWVLVLCNLVNGYNPFHRNVVPLYSGYNVLILKMQMMCFSDLRYKTSTLIMEVICYSEMVVTTYKTTQHQNPDHNQHFNHCENIKSHLL
jgi:uncharacterized protein YhhL (DUF1145 family)